MAEARCLPAERGEGLLRPPFPPYNKKFSSIVLLGLFAGLQPAFADNPIISHKFTADPSALVHDGRVYVYCSNDDNNTTNKYKLVDYTLISSDDLVNWTDHGQIFNAKEDSTWATWAYAPTVIEKEGSFFLYFPNGGTSIGVAKADRPEGPFVDQLGKPLVEKDSALNTDVAWCFDPCVFIDDDGQAYLYFGGGKNEKAPFGKNLRVVQLNDDLISFSGKASTLITPTSFEGPFMHKRNGIYYMSYPQAGCSDIHYMMGDNPMVLNFKTMGSVLDNPAIDGKRINMGNNSHTSIIEFKGKDYIFYHDRRISNGSRYRNVSLDRIKYNADGTFKKVIVTHESVPQIKWLNPFERIEAETMDQQQGIAVENCDEGGCMLTDLSDGDWTSLTGVDFGKGATRFEARVSSTGAGGSIELHLDSPDGPIIGTCTVPSTGSLTTWKTVSCAVKKTKGVKNLFLVYRGDDELFQANWFRFFDH